MMLSFVLLAGVIASSPLETVQRALSAHQGFEAQFVQEMKQDLFPNQKDLAKGNIQFSRPSRLKWEYESPRKSILLYDGKKLTREEDGQKEELKEVGEMQLQETLAFLWGRARSDLYRIDAKDARSFVLRPKRPDQTTFEKIEVRINKQGLVEEAIVYSKLGDISKLTFSAWRLH